MIDHLLGRPSAAYKRTQVLLVLLFWTATLLTGNKNGPPLVRWLSKKFRARLTPWQVLAGTLTCLYAVKNADSLLGLSAPEPLARLYSRDFYRATWMVTALDTGFATAMHVRPKWLREILSMLFSGYYLLFANEADEKLRKFRAVCTVEMLRATWEKTGSPLIRAATFMQRPRIQLKKQIILPRPPGSPYSKPIVAWLYFEGTEDELAFCRELILDFPGGGFVCMGPLHHEERIHRWTIRTGRPVLSIDYSKAPEYPYPYAMHEGFDIYRLLCETKGAVIGMQQGEIRTVMTGDSAGANIGAAVMIKILEMPPANRLPLPLSLIWTYPALDFNFTSFMPPEHLRILRHESSAALRGVAEQKDHLKHASPLAVVDDPPPRHRRRKSWSKSLSKLPSTLMNTLKSPLPTPALPLSGSGGITRRLPIPPQFTGSDRMVKDVVESPLPRSEDAQVDEGAEADNDGEGDDPRDQREQSISERVQYWNPDRGYAELDTELTSPTTGKKQHAPLSALGTRLTMTSRTGFFNDRIISPSMMRAMAICYVGPRNSPDLSKNYYISPILTPAALLAQFPPVYLLCGERDPFSDDTLIFSGRLRDAKLARKAEVQAKLNKHGEGLRMSSAAAAQRDPILDETEDDWVTTRFIEGWSHGFMQMVSLLPKVEHFFALTADWATFSFDRYEEQLLSAARVPTATPVRTMSPAGTTASPRPYTPQSALAGQESTSEKEEEEPLSFVPKRRGSRTTSPSPAASIRAQMLGSAPASGTDGEKTFHRSPLSSESTSDSNAGYSTSTAATSVTSGQRASSADIKVISPPSSALSTRRTSPSEGTASRSAGDPIRRVMRDDADLLHPPSSSKLSPSGSRIGVPHPHEGQLHGSSLPAVAGASGTVTPSLRKPSDAVENAMGASAFVEASDLIKRRREDAVYNLGSAIVSSDHNLGSALITSDHEGSSSSSSDGGGRRAVRSP